MRSTEPAVCISGLWSVGFDHNFRHSPIGDIASALLSECYTIPVGSAKIAGDLEKRSINYSDRPRTTMGGELSGWGKMMSLQ